MKISTIVKHVNRVVGKGSYSFDELGDYFDEAIDAINSDLNVELPLITEVYANNFTQSDDEAANYEYAANDVNNEYLRIPAAYIRGYIAYEAAFRILRDEDEDDEVLAPKQRHAQIWYRRLVAAFNDYTLEDTEVVSIGGDADELGTTSIDDTGIGFYNPIDPIDNQ